jgi:hypothetical protein
MPNKYISQPPTEVMRARLKVLLENVNYLYTSKETVLEEDIVNAYHTAMDIFLQSLDGSICGAVAKILKGSPADPFHYNVFTRSIQKDLEALFAETGALDKLIVATFNSVIAEREQVIQVSRRVSDKLGTYLLYADPTLGGGYFFGDSFNGAENIEVGSDLLDTDECFLGQNEGVILLPLDGDPDKPKIKSYTINKPSNGTAGNNYETDVLGKDEIEAIGDSEPNTWYEYEKVTAYESDTPLILDITIALDEISVINHIHLNPINFGTPTPVTITTLETSKDGLEYMSVKDEVPIKDFVSEEEENVFDLSPATAKFAGQGFYSFLPRKAQFVHVVLEQHTPYAITTTNGTRLRYAIGVRDIDILGRKFKPEGSLISVPISLEEEARKVALWASENPVEVSTLSDITHAISENDGATWRAIQPQRRSGFTTPEVINYNTIANGAIETDIPVETLRHKISMTRNTDAFSGDVTLKEEKETQIDVLNVPTGGDFSFTTSQQPIKETVRVILPFYGSWSCPTDRYGSTVAGNSTPMDLDFLEFNVDVPPVGTLRYKLPFKKIPNLPEHIRVFVNGEQIEYCGKTDEALGNVSGGDSYTSYTVVDSDSKVYFLNKGGAEIQFGYTDSTGTQRGFLPPTGAKIQICLDGDNPRLELTDKGYVLMLTTSSDGFKENISLISMDNLSSAEATDYAIELPAGRDKILISLPQKTKISSMSGEAGLEYLSPAGGITDTASTTEDANLESSLNIPQSYLMTDVSDTADPLEDELDTVAMSVVVESTDGSIPPVFIDDLTAWGIVEYSLTTGLPLTSGQQFTDKKEYIDGRQELMTWTGSVWQQNENAYSFDASSGIVYTGSVPLTDRRTMFYCKRLTVTEVPAKKWEYYKTTVHGRMNTQKIVIDPAYVKTQTRVLAVDGTSTSVNSVELIGAQTASHSWFKQRLVKGTVVIDHSLFPDNVKITEVPYIDGTTELNDVVQIENEAITFTSAGGSLYTYQLGSINTAQTLVGQPGFAAVRSVTNPVTQESLFVTYVAGTPSSPGQWTYTIDGSGNCIVTIYVHSSINPTTRSHVVTYKYSVSDPGIDMSGLYSIDYETGTIHFAAPITLTGNIQYEVSAYTAFYNMADIVSDGDIDNIDEEGMKITISTSLGMRFLKMSTAMKARPAFAKVVYDYYKKSSESLIDLEPYFSPICKDIALKAITVSTIEEL